MTGLWGRVAAVQVRVGMRGLDTYDRWDQTERKTKDCGEPVAVNLHGGFGGGDAETCAPQGVRARRVPIQSLRQRLARFVRKTLSFSKSPVMHEVCLRLFLHRYNLERASILK